MAEGFPSVRKEWSYGFVRGARSKQGKANVQEERKGRFAGRRGARRSMEHERELALQSSCVVEEAAAMMRRRSLGVKCRV